MRRSGNTCGPVGGRAVRAGFLSAVAPFCSPADQAPRGRKLAPRSYQAGLLWGLPQPGRSSGEGAAAAPDESGMR